MLGKMFRLCQPFDGTRKENIATLVETLLGNFETIVQYNKAQLRFERQLSVHKKFLIMWCVDKKFPSFSLFQIIPPAS